MAIRAAILVLPDALTRLGGSQYVNSSAVGRYTDYVADELVAFIDETYPTRPGAAPSWCSMNFSTTSSHMDSSGAKTTIWLSVSRCFPIDSR